MELLQIWLTVVLSTVGLTLGTTIAVLGITQPKEREK